MTVKFDESISFWMPFPPSVNTLFPTNRLTGKRYPSRKYTAWKKEVWALLKQARVPLIESRVDIEIELTAVDKRIRDADNYTKAVVDALVEAGVLPDDNSKNVRSVKPCWCDHDKDEAGALVIITPVPPPDTKKKTKPLTEAQLKLLESFRAESYQLVEPDHRPSRTLQALLLRGHVQPIPALIGNNPQGYKLAE